jgi:hypothetical protein
MEPQGVFDLGEFFAIEMVDGLTADVARVDRAQLVDKEAGRLSLDLDQGTEGRRLRTGRSGNHGRHRPMRRARAEGEAEAMPPLLVTAFGVTEINSIEGAADHQASASSERFSSASRSVSIRALSKPGLAFKQAKRAAEDVASPRPGACGTGRARLATAYVQSVSDAEAPAVERRPRDGRPVEPGQRVNRRPMWLGYRQNLNRGPVACALPG